MSKLIKIVAAIAAAALLAASPAEHDVAVGVSNLAADQNRRQDALAPRTAGGVGPCGLFFGRHPECMDASKASETNGLLVNLHDAN